MNKVYLTCKVVQIGDICFDYYNAIKPYVILECLDMDRNSNMFKVVVYNKMYEKAYEKIKEWGEIFVRGRMYRMGVNHYVIANEIEMI